MYLENISLVNFKNYDTVELKFSSKINCFVGNNGVGKTNLLDAIYYLSFCKSYFNFVDTQNIKHERDYFIVQGNYIKKDSKENIYCNQKRNQKKQFKRNKKLYDKLSDHIGFIPLVMISPFDINLIIEGSDERRKFIDGVISQYDRQYLEDLIKYNRALLQRNILLKDFFKRNYFDAEAIQLWNDQLILYANNIHIKRVKFIKDLILIFQKYYNYISLDSEKIELEYYSQLNDEDYSTLLKNTIDKDRLLQYTTTGIHKDDIVMKLSGYPIKNVGSQGQQKTFLVALKFAQFDFMREINGYKPILLLDDLFDKFDSKRVKQIINLVADNNFKQIFITDTNYNRLTEILSSIDIEHSVFNINNDNIELYEKN